MNVVSKEKWLNVNKTNILKIIMAFGIVLHHLSFNTNDVYVIKIFKYFGFMFCSMFFFLSGFGLYISMKKDNNYFKTYSKRFKKVIIPFLEVFLIYFLFDIFYFKKDIINFNIFSIVNYSWYVYEQLIFYILFYIFFKKENNKNLILFVLSVVLMTFLFYFLGISDVWWKSSFGFVFGIIFAKNYEKIYNLYIKKYLSIGMFSFFAIAISLMLGKYFDLKVFEIAIYGISSVLFCNLLCLLMLFIKSNYKLKFLNCSYELYLIHGLIIELLLIKNGYIRVSLVLLISLVIAWIINYFNRLIFKRKK